MKLFWYCICNFNKWLTNFEHSMGGYWQKVILPLFLLFAVFCEVSAQGKGHRILFVDQNYKDVTKEKEATYVVDVFDYGDTVYFETRSKTPRGLIEKGRYPANQGYDLRNCFVQKLWPNGELRSEGYLKNSWAEGHWKFYDESGQLYSEVEYIQGLMTGQAKRFYNNGNVRTYTYVGNIRQGESVLYDTSGRIHAIRNYLNDSLHGLSVDFYESGKTQRKTLYSHGLKVRDSWYYEAGNLFNAEKYDGDGKLDGRCMMFTPSGKIARLDEFAHGEAIQNDCIHPLAGAEWEGDDCPPRLLEAKYPGGLEKYIEYVNLNQDYPELAIQWKQQGIVIYEFTVTPYGFIEDVTQENIIPVGYGMERESMRLLKKLQRFDPEKLNGKAIPVRVQMPYVFSLQD